MYLRLLLRNKMNCILPVQTTDRERVLVLLIKYSVFLKADGPYADKHKLCTASVHEKPEAHSLIAFVILFSKSLSNKTLFFSISPTSKVYFFVLASTAIELTSVIFFNLALRAKSFSF